MLEHKTVSLAEQVFERLERDILGGVYPRGALLTELGLGNDLYRYAIAGCCRNYCLVESLKVIICPLGLDHGFLGFKMKDPCTIGCRIDLDSLTFQTPKIILGHYRTLVSYLYVIDLGIKYV